jgi:hypothetical protein
MRLLVRLGVKRGIPREEKTNAPLGFHGSSRAHWTPTKAWCFSRHMSPISGQSDSWAGACQREKISPARARADVPNFVCVATFLDGRPRRRTLPTTPLPESKGYAEPRSTRALSPPEPPTTKDGNINPFPFRRAGASRCPTFRKRPSPVSLGPPDPRPSAVPWEPFSMLQASRVSLEYLLLPPRSALVPVPRALTLHASTLCLPNSTRGREAPRRA